MKTTPPSTFSLITAVLIFALSTRTFACPVCYLLPTKTTADILIESEFVVLARENPNQSFSYATVEELKGASFSNDFELFIDSTTRRILKSNPGFAVVLVRKSEWSPWQSLGVTDDKYQQIIKRILAFSRHWTGKNGLQQRYSFFLTLFGDDNRAIHELAYLELGRAPYRTIKRMAKQVSKDDLRMMLTRREYLQWRSLAILLLAQNANDQDRKLIEDSFQNCQQFSLDNNLAAWATAYVEIHGPPAVAEIEQSYLRESNRSESEIRAIVMALSVHGRNGHRHLRDQIVESYGIVLQSHPMLADLIANDLTEWKSLKYHDQLMAIVENRDLKLDSQNMESIQNYLKLSRASNYRDQ